MADDPTARTGTGASALDVAEALFVAIEAGHIDVVRSLYADHAVVWHSHDGALQTPDENILTLAWATNNLSDMRYTEIRRSATSDGFVQQHVLCATNRAGRAVAIPACIVCIVEQGLVTRLDEYLDSGHLAEMLAR